MIAMVVVEESGWCWSWGICVSPSCWKLLSETHDLKFEVSANFLS